MHCYRLSGEGSGADLHKFFRFLEGEVSLASIVLRVMSCARV